jgi:hypothetical protein
VADAFQPASTFANKCAAPRSGVDPATGRRYPDTAGTSLDEKNFLRSWTHDTYLWFEDVAYTNPALTPNVLNYFDTLKTMEILPSGRAKDQFHFTYDSAEWYALSESGVSVGYGITWDLVSSTPPRKLVVRFVQPGSEAALKGIRRGVEILTADGVNLANGSNVATLNAALFSPAQGSTHTFTFRTREGVESAAISLTADALTLDPVPTVRVLPTSTGNVGYIQFDDHIATAEKELVDAVKQLQAAQITDLVLDLRYNGGGFLGIASELAYMVAGSDRTDGKTFENMTFNSTYTAKGIDAVTGDPLEPFPFLPVTLGYSLPSNQALPQLNLPRVFVLTTADTCSASESIINGLRGVDVEVIQIGGDTCGKPYGFYPQENCGTTYFSIQFKGVNHKGFGDYAEGFSPVNYGQPLEARLPGCRVADDYGYDLGDENEAMLRIALSYRAIGVNACPLVLSGTRDLERLRATSATSVLPGNGLSLRAGKEPWRENRILR